VALTSVKLAADRSGDLVVRVHEALGGRASGTVRVDVPVASVREVSLLEEPLGPEPASEHPAEVTVTLGPFEVRTLRFRRRA
jgi:alpha-mannosidase